jgi:glucose/arabinose dehydrogenase
MLLPSRPWTPAALRGPLARGLLAFAVAPLTLAAATPSLAAARHDGADLPAGFEAVAISSTLDFPVDLVFRDNGDLFVAEKRGVVRLLRGGIAQSQPVFDLAAEINANADRGLLAIVLHPDFVPDGGPHSWIYACYTLSPIFGQNPEFDFDQQYSHTVLARMPIETVGENLVADESRLQVLMGQRLPDGTVPDAIASLHTSHAIGSLVFGEDGTLLLSHGDGSHHNFTDPGGFDAPGFDTFVHPVTGLRGQVAIDQDSGSFRAMDLRSHAGKILRLDPETGLGLPSNPYFDGNPSSEASRIWTTGLRNPFRLVLLPGSGSTDPAAADPGTLLVGDVGSYLFEELNFIDGPGLHCGWPCVEGFVSQPAYGPIVRQGPNPFGYPDCTFTPPGVAREPMVVYSHFEPLDMYPPGIHADEHGQPLPGITGACVIAGPVYDGPTYPPEYLGRMFFSDYSGNWVKTLSFTGAGAALSVGAFAEGLNQVVAMATHPQTGELYLLELGLMTGTGRLIRVRYGQDLSPVAVLSADPLSGSSPLVVQFDGSGSVDPEGAALRYRWNFGDGSPVIETTAPGVQHTYTAMGTFTASLTVLDPLGLEGTATVPIAVDVLPPLVRIVSPLTGTLLGDLPAVQFEGQGTDPVGSPLTYHWQVNLHHNVHVHPATFTASTVGGSTTAASMSLEPHGDDNETIYYEVTLTATNAAGASSSDRIWLYLADQVIDPSGSGQLISRLDELTPPVPQGNGNRDIEVIRDGLVPTPGAVTDLEQFETFHFGAQGDDDWIGLILAARPAPYARFVSLTYTVGDLALDGGWFDAPQVEVRTGDLWTPVEGQVSVPPYPASGPPPAGGLTYVFHFTPRYGDAIRLRGEPGGAAGYVSCAELRAGLVTTGAAGSEYLSLAAQGELSTLVGQLTPPGSQGAGNPDLELVRNGTTPPVGSPSTWAHYSTKHPAKPAGEDWIAYRFDTPRTVSGVRFQEGRHFDQGGWLENPRIEVRLSPEDPWTVPSGATLDPRQPAPGPGSPTYETFAADFPPVLAQEVRLVGTPGGVERFFTVGEFDVHGPWFDPDLCGFEPYGLELPLFPITLSSDTPPVLGAPLHIGLSGALPGFSTPGALFVAPVPGFVYLPPIGVLLVDPGSSMIVPLTFAPDGTADWFASLPNDPSLAGENLFLQALSVDPLWPGALRYSHGLWARICP